MNGKQLGVVESASWDEGARAVRLRLSIDNGRLRVDGMIYSGLDGYGGYIDPVRLRRAVPRMAGMRINDLTGRLDPARLTLQDIGKMRLQLSLDTMRLGVGTPMGPDTNTFLRAFFG